MTDLLSLTPDELTALLLDIGEPKYRAAQMFPQLHRGISPDEMTNIGRQTRSRLAAVAEYRLPDVRRKLVSRLDGTVKYLFGLADGNCVESVVMTYEHGRTICISSQVGCRMGCRFCASTIGGKVRDLVPGELLGQVIAAQRDLGERISNIVMMGIGEPLDNYDNVVKFLRLVSHPDGLNIGLRHISLDLRRSAEYPAAGGGEYAHHAVDFPARAGRRDALLHHARQPALGGGRASPRLQDLLRAHGAAYFV